MYHYRSLFKIFHFIYLMIGAMWETIVVFPIIRLFTRNEEEYQEAVRRWISSIFRRFLRSIKFWGLIKYEKIDKNRFNDVRSKIIVANHPCILDFVFLMAMFPNASCIARGGLLKGPFGGVIRTAYIPNELEFEELREICKKTLDAGNNIIIFPEGTRTPRTGRNKYKKGAARIAYYTKCDLLPIYIGGSDKYGLGKGDPLWSFNPIEKMLFDFTILPEIKYEDYKDFSDIIAAKRMTKKCEEMIVGFGEEYNKNHPNCKTVNNI